MSGYNPYTKKSGTADALIDKLSSLVFLCRRWRLF